MLKYLNKVYTKDYGYPTEYRLQAVFDSILHGVDKAAEKHRVSVTSLYRWRRDYSEALELLSISKG